ncbi:hypothetical protein Tco_1198036 [Tanacetum coccineum]
MSGMGCSSLDHATMMELTKKVESLEADLEKYREEVKGNFAALGNKLDYEVEALRKRQKLEDKRYELLGIKCTKAFPLLVILVPTAGVCSHC